MQMFINIVAAKLKTKVSYLLSHLIWSYRLIDSLYVYCLRGEKKCLKEDCESKQEEDWERDTHLKEDWWGIVL